MELLISCLPYLILGGIVLWMLISWNKETKAVKSIKPNKVKREAVVVDFLDDEDYPVENGARRRSTTTPKTFNTLYGEEGVSCRSNSYESTPSPSYSGCSGSSSSE